MLIDFFFKLRAYRVPVSIRELLDLLRALEKGVVYASTEEFYFLSRLTMVKDESHYDKFNRAFADYFEGVESIDLLGDDIPEEWLRKQFEKNLTEEEKAQIKALGGLEEIMKAFEERLKEQKKRHEGGNKWVGTGGTSPFGAFGYNPEGVRVGQHKNRNFSAVKVWDKRTFKNLSGDVELGTRNIKLALRKLRHFARTGATDELDISSTISSTAKNAGYLDLKMVPERHNAVKVLMFFDVGGSMDAHIQSCEELFSAARTEFKHLEFFYFHNCVYENVWTDNKRRTTEGIPLLDIIHKYGADYKVLFVGDATMGPYEITYPGGSVEHWNEEPGATWMQRLLNHFEHAAWLNPQPPQYWNYYHSISILNEIMEERMFPLTLDGISQAIKEVQ